ncbi:hemerythrin domain-containing protein [Nannocystis sp. SCPEA4]|uniref:hemerythrin domain-containing protein n=1 Tax=Nannocystis sp. SCPEA4 TaxID=2996787 RepID=UPI0022716B88|nr:hemerythrin domain-containing protein [Nannocystis sp. SCPEA4]MCY1062725.1 hemerythrin domain-containing protein [Nannocystis sp. SCPEA4]
MRSSRFDTGRRDVLLGGAGLGLGLLTGCTRERDMQTDEEDEPEEEVTPTEDLMREHGVLERLLLVYEAALARFAAHDVSPLATLDPATDLMRRFVEDYHEKLEEQFLFPRLEEAGEHQELVATLRRQHQRGRELTDAIRKASAGPSLDALAAEGPLQVALRGYVRMMRPHAAREDTVVFPAFRGLVRGPAFVELGERFEEKEHALFGGGGFQTIVAEVGELEKALEIHDLERFTP